MKYVLSFLALSILTLSAAGQQAASAGAGSTSMSGASGGGTSAPRSGKVELPPEKARPMRVPLTTAAPVIDGRLDEEVWKQAAVFKDFYQTGPGYNTQPSKPTEVYMF